MPPLDAIHHHLSIEFLFRASQGLDGLGAAWSLWHGDPELQQLAGDAEIAWNQRTDTYQSDPKDDHPGSVPILLVNAAVNRGADAPHAWLRALVDHGSPDFSIIRKKSRSERTDGEERWDLASVHLRNPKLGELLASWKSLTPGFLQALTRGLPDVALPSPDEVGDMAAMARIQTITESVLAGKVAGGQLHDASRSPALSEDPRIPLALQALTELSPDLAGEYAETLLRQQEAWQAAGVLPSRRFDFLIPSLLAELATFNGPLTGDHRALAGELDITYPSGVTLEPGEDLSIKDAREESCEDIDTSYLRDGFTLVEVPEGNQPTTLVVTSELELVSMGMKKPLLVVLDLDLTHPDLAFLGLQGTRLRICDRAAPPEVDEPLFTKVTLDGGVKALRLTQKHPVPEMEHIAPEHFALGRRLVSPFEGLKSAGELGCATKIGGAPDWEQYPEDPLSPKGGKPMTFIAQIEHPLGGTAYAFLDYRNLVATVVTQNS